MAHRQLQLFEAQIRFAPDILVRLGEELNPSPDQGILELVRNAYDANARSCIVELQGTDREGGSIRVVDDGDGMSRNQIEQGWLVLGKSMKSAQTLTRLGRVPAGNKGLGRLAALRMGRKVKMVSRPWDEPPSEYQLDIDWRAYDRVKLIDDVTLTIKEVSRAQSVTSGTEITVGDLRQRIGRMDVKRLARAMILLADPFGKDSVRGFEPILRAPEFSDLESLVKGRYFSDAEYHLIARLDDCGRPSATVVDWRGNELFSAKNTEFAPHRETKTYNCPATRFDLWAYLLTKSAFSTRTATSLGEVREWLQGFGGVHIYQNGLRVTPYGNPGNDWLDMNLRRAQSPEERPSTNNAIGRVEIADPRELLVQKTDRSGFIESDTFLELKAFAQDALEWMARRRMEIAQRRRAAERQKAPMRSQKNRKKLDEAIGQAPMAAQPPIREAVDAYQRSRDKEVAHLRREIQLYRTLSTAGITTATFAHESSGNPIKVIDVSVRTIERSAKRILGDKYGDLQKPIERIKGAAESLGVLGAATLKLLAHEKRRPSRVDIHKTLHNVVETFGPFLTGRDVALDLELCEGCPYLRATEAAVESIITNLLNNSLAAFERTSCEQRRIAVRTQVHEAILLLRVLDNGPGITDISIKDIWLPGVTTRQNGTGLGLTIVRDAVADLGGEVQALDRSELGGAEIRIRLPILGV